MKTITASAAKDLGHFLAKDFRRIFGSSHDKTGRSFPNISRIVLRPNDRLQGQLAGLERRTSAVGRDTISHPDRGHDDVANAVAGAATLTKFGGVSAEVVNARPYPRHRGDPHLAELRREIMGHLGLAESW